jgi:hypothetical protein
VADDIATGGIGERNGPVSDSGLTSRASARRRLVLGAAAVLPSVVTLPSGAQVAQSSNLRCWSRVDPDGPITQGHAIPQSFRFTTAPDGWLRKQIYYGQCGGRVAFCTTWDQLDYPSITQTIANGTPRARDGTTWWVDGWSLTASTTNLVDQIAPTKDYHALVFVDATASTYTLEPQTAAQFHPVLETCWTSMLDGRKTFLG